MSEGEHGADKVVAVYVRLVVEIGRAISVDVNAVDDCSCNILIRCPEGVVRHQFAAIAACCCQFFVQVAASRVYVRGNGGMVLGN